MMNSRVRLLFVLLGLACAAGWNARAEELTLLYRGQSVKGKYLYLDIGIAGDISYDTVDAIRNGITADFLVNLHLVRTGGIFDSRRELVRQKTENFTISYDVWENVFLIQHKSKKKEYQARSPSDIVSQIDRSMSTVRMTVPSEEKSGRYIVKGRIKIQTIKLFPPFGIFLYFFDPWNYDSGWISSETFDIEKPQR
jgi:hypothetical protein